MPVLLKNTELPVTLPPKNVAEDVFVTNVPDPVLDVITPPKTAALACAPWLLNAPTTKN